MDPTTSPSGTPAPRDVVRAVDDLAATLGIDAGEVEVVSVEEVTWRDGSRGCAQPGMAYTQALIDGSRITLRAGGGPTSTTPAAASHPLAATSRPSRPQ